MKGSEVERKRSKKERREREQERPTLKLQGHDPLSPVLTPTAKKGSKVPFASETEKTDSKKTQNNSVEANTL